MIRPIEYCESIMQIDHTVKTIDQRIMELLDLREIYCTKAKELENFNEISTISSSFEKLNTLIQQNDFDRHEK